MLDMESKPHSPYRVIRPEDTESLRTPRSPAAGQLDPMITAHYSLDEWETAFANLRGKQDVKAFIHPNGVGWV
jgi:hypothetical protein